MVCRWGRQVSRTDSCISSNFPLLPSALLSADVFVLFFVGALVGVLAAVSVEAFVVFFVGAFVGILAVVSAGEVFVVFFVGVFVGALVIIFVEDDAASCSPVFLKTFLTVFFQLIFY